VTHRLPATITQRMLITGTPNTVSILKSFPTCHEIFAKLLFLTAISLKENNKFLGKFVEKKTAIFNSNKLKRE
jgi:hypothetical protein